MLNDILSFFVPFNEHGCHKSKFNEKNREDWQVLMLGINLSGISLGMTEIETPV